jgi:serine/threonine-protein phosphatase 2B catalytic subunit
VSADQVWVTDDLQQPSIISRKSDIENERLPPDLFDAESDEGKAIMSATPPSLAEEMPPSPVRSSGAAPWYPNGAPPVSPETLAAALSSSNPPPSSPSSPITPGSPTSPPLTPFRRGHGRQASLGTTMTSPSNRRRSIESTISLIQEAWDGKEELSPNSPETPQQSSGGRTTAPASS